VPQTWVNGSTSDGKIASLPLMTRSLTLVANSKMGAMNLFTPASEEQRNRVNACTETPTSVGESRLERIRHQCLRSFWANKIAVLSLSF
jgi:hypothetical protein